MSIELLFFLFAFDLIISMPPLVYIGKNREVRIGDILMLLLGLPFSIVPVCFCLVLYFIVKIWNKLISLGIFDKVIFRL